MPHIEPEGRLYIDGQFREAAGGGCFDVVNPADESLVGTAADGHAEDVAAAVGAARRAADETSWGSDHAFRQRVLRQLQDALRKEAAAAKQIQIAEAGTPISNIGAHIDVMTEDMSYFNDLIGRFPWQADFGVCTGNWRNRSNLLSVAKEIRSHRERSGRVFDRVRDRDHPAAAGNVGSDIGKAHLGGGDDGRSESGASCGLRASCKGCVWHLRKACLPGVRAASLDPTQDTGAPFVGSATGDPIPFDRCEVAIDESGRSSAGAAGQHDA